MKNLLIYIALIISPLTYYAQNGASTPGVADNTPITLPYHKSNHTTVSKGNNVQDPGGIVNSYTSGNDYFYFYCPSSSGDITISLQYLSTSTGVAPYISVWDADPSSASANNLIADISSPGYSASTMNASLELVASLVGGSCYYIMIDNWPGPSGFEYDISVYNSPINPGCSFIDFESGLTNWTVTTGDVSKGKNADPHTFYEPTSFTISATQHKLVTAANGNDPVVGAAIPQLCPWGGTQSLRLGDGTSTGGYGATVEQRFSVDASNAMFNYYYAVVLEDPSGHSLQEKPMFKIDVLDCDGNPLSCGEYLVVSSAPGFVAYNYGSGYYKEWTPVFLDLSSYIGSCVTVRFRTGDCSLSGHYGYAYIDASCGPLDIEGPDSVCAGVPETISTPAGAASYSWTIQGDPTVIGTSQDLIISPSVNTTYECVLTSVTGCTSTLTKPIVVINGPTVDDILDQTVCGTYTLPSITGTNLTGNENFYYDSQSNGGTPITGPITTTQTIWIYDELYMCNSEQSFTITVNTMPTLTLTTPSICNSGLSTIQATVSPSAAYDYSWTVPTGVSDPGNVNNFTSNVPGTYTVSISNSNILCNTDFDNTVITSIGNYSTINQSSMPCWSTTASDNKIEVWGSGFNGVPAYSGNQFVELNANLVSTLYQDFTAIPNSSVTISFAHRGRNGTDVLSVEIGPVGGPYTNLGNFSAGNSSWKYNTVNYTFPNNGITNYTLRFNSVSAAGGATMGNFLDAISIVTSSCLPSPVSSTLIVTSIDINNPGNQTVCDSYTLPTITGTNLSGNENYYDDSQANGGNIITGPITSTQTVWIYDINGSCSDEESFLVTVNQTPVITNPGNQVVCDSYSLPTISGTNLSGNENYYDDSQANGGNIITGSITSTQTVWIYDINGSCSDEESFLVTVNQTPLITNSGNQTLCDSYTLPTITGTNLSGNENYYDDSQTNGGNIIAGPITSTQMIWIYDADGSCSDEESFTVTINNTPVLNNPGNQTACDSYNLPVITGTNLSGNQNYYNNSQANGGTILSGPITTSQTIWIYDANESCSYEESFIVTINITPIITNNPGALSVCSPYNLPTITGTNLSGNQNYYDDSQANGGSILTGPLNSTQTVWIYDINNGCSDEQSFVLTVDNTPPSITNPGNQTACDSYTLPVITGTNLSGNQKYYNDSQANGGTVITGPITTTQTVWMYEVNGTCSDEESFIVTINNTPSINSIANQTVCDSYTLPLISGTNLSGNQNYYNDSQANGGTVILGPITSTQTVWIYDNNGSCFDEINFDVNVNHTPSITNPGNQTACDSYTLPTITGSNLSGSQNYYNNSQSNGGIILTGPITTSQTVWIYDEDGSCNDETNFTVTINNTPTINNPGDQTVCDSYTLPVISGINLSGNQNYYNNSQANGGTIVSGPITTTQTIWIYDINGNCPDEVSFLVTINNTPTITNPGNQTVCDSYTLPVISGTNLSGNQNFYNNSQLNGGTLISGPITSSQTIWIYDNNGTCSDEVNFNVIINNTPTITSPGNQIVCGSYNLPMITGTNLSGNQNYYNDSQANGGIVISGPITTSQTIWIYDADGSCSDEINFDVTVNYTPTITNPGNQTVCDSYTLPVISGTNLSGNQNYYNGNQANGGTIISGPITSTQTIWIYDADGSCADEESFIVTINYTPTLNTIADQTVCDSYTLPSITGTNLSGNQNFFNNSQVNGGTIISGPITSTQTIWVYDADGTCSDENNFIITVNPTPLITNPGNTAACVTYNLPSINGVNLSGNQKYYDNSQSNNGSIINGPITSSQTVWIYDNIGSCSNEESFDIIINPLPTATVSGTTAICVNDANPSITFTGANGTAPYTFTYNINGGANTTVSTTSGNSVTVSQSTANAGTFTYNLVSVQDASSTACSQAQTGSATVTINPLPTATISGTTAICVNDASPSITFTGANGTAPYTFTYNINGGANTTVSTTSGNSVTVSQSTANAGTFTYNLVSVQDASSTACSQAQTGSSTVTINPLPTATVSGTTAICVSDANPSITFTGANGTAPYTFTYNINGGANTTVTTTSGNSVTVSQSSANAGTFTYNLVSVQDASSTACSQAQTGSATVTINPLPTTTVSGTTAICVNDANPSITFTGANGTAPYTFTYNINGGANTTVTTTSGNSFTVSQSSAIAGTFTYNLVTVQDASSTTCSQAQTGSAPITVNPLPTATISGSTTLCVNDANPNITFTGANGTAPYTFTYNINGGANTTVTTTSGNSVTVSQSSANTGTFTYNLVSVQDASSTACSQAQTGSAIITFNPLPTATISGTTTICVNDANPNVTFTGANGTAPYTFIYNINGGANTTVTTTSGNSVTVSQSSATAGTFTYNLVSVQDASSTTCSQAQTGSATITVNPLPTATVSGTTAICVNDANPSITFTGANGTAPYTFTYNINGGANTTVTTTSGNSVTVSQSSANAGTFTYNLVSVQDASSTACSQAQTGSASITVYIVPVVTFSADTTSGCLPLQVTFTNNSLPVSGYVHWDFGDGTTFESNSTVNSISHTFLTEGCFDIQLISQTNLCIDSTTTNSMICTFPKANADFSVDAYEKTLANPIFNFTNLSTNSNSYIWDFDDEETSTETDPTHYFLNDPRKFYVTLIANNDYNCSDTTSKYIELKDELIYYVPNAFTPNNDEFNNTFKPTFYSGVEIQGYTMYIFNRWGQLIFETHDMDKGWNGKYGGPEGVICPDGMYVWKIHFKERMSDKETIISGHIILYK